MAKGGMHCEGGVHGKGGVHGEGGCVVKRGYVWLGGACMAGGGYGGRACVAGETAIAAGGTHSTGMHSCFTIVSFVQYKYIVQILICSLNIPVPVEIVHHFTSSMECGYFVNPKVCLFFKGVMFFYDD